MFFRRNLAEDVLDVSQVTPVSALSVESSQQVRVTGVLDAGGVDGARLEVEVTWDEDVTPTTHEMVAVVLAVTRGLRGGSGVEVRTERREL